MIAPTIQFRIPNLSVGSRLIVFVSCALVALILQIFVPGAFFWGTLVMVLPMAVLAARPWTNKPKDLGEEDWQPTGDAELDRIADSFQAAKKISLPFWYKPGSGIPATVLLGLFALGGAGTPVGLAALDALILLWPTLYFLKIKFWVPQDFKMVMTAIQAARSEPVPPGVLVTPYLRLDRDDAGLRIPEDARLLVESRRKPEDLVGIQLQAAINSGPNGKVPYLYAVVLTKGRGATWNKASRLSFDGFETEPGGDDDYGTVVIRQQTDRGGYQTTPKQCRRLVNIVYQVLGALK
jgi:hypothetical protein